MYEGAESCVRVNGKESSWFAINSGVRQGCVAAPDLFNCVIDYLMERVSEQVPGVQLGSYTLGDLEYADDAALLCSSLQDLRRALTVFSKEAKLLGLTVNWGKTELMCVGETRTIPSPLLIENQSIYFVPDFIYLGSKLSHDGSLLPEVNRRRDIAAGVMQGLKRPLWRHRNISRATKIRIYNSSVISVLLYGSETWPKNKSLEARLDGFEII